MNQRFQGKTAVVTGGSRGFGRGIVEALIAEGAFVVAVARNGEHLAELERAHEGKVETVAGDATDALLCARIIERTRPDAVIVNAGSRSLVRPLKNHTWETFSVNFNVDVKSAFVWSREALLLPLARGSSIVLISSGAAFSTAPNIAGYASAKAAIHRFAFGIAQEAAPLGIRVRTLAPALTPNTDLGREAVEAFARAAGKGASQILAEKGTETPLTTEMVGRGVIDLLTRDSADVAFKIDSGGLQPIA